MASEVLALGVQECGDDAASPMSQQDPPTPEHSMTKRPLQGSVCNQFEVEAAQRTYSLELSQNKEESYNDLELANIDFSKATQIKQPFLADSVENYSKPVTLHAVERRNDNPPAGPAFYQNPDADTD